MRGLPAICPKCAIVFEDQQHRFMAVSGLAVSYMTTACPKCKGVAEVLDGTYSVIGDMLESETPSQPRAEMVKHLNGLRQDLSKSPSITDDIIAALEIAEPKLAAAAKLLKSKRWGAAVLAALIWIAKIRMGSSGGSAPIIDMSSHTTVQVIGSQQRGPSYTYYWQKPRPVVPPAISGHNRERSEQAQKAKEQQGSGEASPSADRSHDERGSD